MLPGEWPEPDPRPVTATQVRVDVEADFSEWLSATDAFPDGVPPYWDAETLAEELGKRYLNPQDMLKEWDIGLAISVRLLDDQDHYVTVEFGSED